MQFTIIYFPLTYFSSFNTIRAAAMTLRTVLLSLQALLAAAEPDDPQDAVVAYQYKDKYQLFVTTARHWTNVYAGGKFLKFLNSQIFISQYTRIKK